MKIYIVTNRINGKIYVGQTIKSLKQRWSQHCKDTSCVALYNAIKKYGSDEFDIKLLEECFSLDELNECEIKWINELNAIGSNGYNIREGGKGGGALSENTKNKIKEKALKRWETPEFKKKMKKAYSKRSNNQEWKNHLAESQRGHKSNPNQLKALQKSWFAASKPMNGESNGRAILTEDQVREIRYIYSTKKISQSKLGEQFGVSQITISAIVRRKLWAHVV